VFNGGLRVKCPLWELVQNGSFILFPDIISILNETYFQSGVKNILSQDDGIKDNFW
jgi:hypothetical protein